MNAVEAAVTGAIETIPNIFLDIYTSYVHKAQLRHTPNDLDRTI